ncbi:hypothetical protein C8R48DRAFT_770283 [Suillus tomentosus]|nr:hypothetical protein C8R48DRAFT_770283 [Suillus tomentosus]
MSPKHKPSSATSLPASALQKLQNSAGGFYAAMPRLICHIEYFIGGQDENILVSKGGRLQPTEFIIHGVFEISCNDFSFTLDGNFNPSNVFHGCFADVKLSYFLDILDNLAHFKGLIPRPEEYDKLSVIHNSLSQRSIKLMHSLFEANNNQQDTAGKVYSDENYWHDDLNPKFDITTWPVADRCKGHLESMVLTHSICPCQCMIQIIT